MPRSPRIVDTESWHHLTLRGADRQDVFTDDHDRLHLEDLLGEIAVRFGVETHAYCFMSNHLHLLEHCTDGKLSEAMQHLASSYAGRYNWRHDRSGPLFGGRRPTPDWLRTSTVLGLVAGSAIDYRAFVLDRQPTDPEPSRHHLVPTRADIESAVCSVIGADNAALQTTARGVRNDARLLTILLLTESRSATTEQLAEWYGFTSTSSVRNAARRARVLETDDPAFARLRQRVEQLLWQRAA